MKILSAKISAAIVSLAVLPTFNGCGRSQSAPPTPMLTAAPGVKIVNGKWFDGQQFRERTVYMSRGAFVDRPRTEPDSVIDLHGGYVVPPFAEAHNHNFDASTPQGARALVAKYQKEGVFYGQNPANVLRAREGLKGFINIPTGIDVTFSNALLTGPGGHPIGLYLRNLGRGAMLPTDTNTAAGFMWIIRSEADFMNRWTAILSSNPDFIKVILAYSDQYEKRLADTATFNWRGIDPRIVPAIVTRSHSAGLRVMAHVETAADFRNALASGVDIIGHIPGFRGNEQTQLPDLAPYLITDADAARAARQGTFVVTTLGGIVGVTDTVFRNRGDSLFTMNLRTLRKHGVRIIIGSDAFRETSVPEAIYLSSLGVYTNAELLRAWTETTPLAIFPKRRLGHLATGYESSFVVLNRNPLENFSSVTDIALRVKQGFTLQ
jgi:imidazolonepropionase-like amidohydrolase